MINDLKWKLNKAPATRYSVSERVLFIGGGVMFCFAFVCGLLGIGL